MHIKYKICGKQKLPWSVVEIQGDFDVDGCLETPILRVLNELQWGSSGRSWGFVQCQPLVHHIQKLGDHGADIGQVEFVETKRRDEFISQQPTDGLFESNHFVNHYV